MQSLTKLIYELNIAEDNVKTGLIEALKKCKDNPDIDRLSSNCFSMKMSESSLKDWSSEYYDFKHQYRTLQRVIQETDIRRLEEKLYTILETGKLTEKSGRKYYTYHFHRDVLLQLLKITDFKPDPLNDERLLPGLFLQLQKKEKHDKTSEKI